jgi:hypothetical protein
MFLLRQARLARLLRSDNEAEQALTRVLALRNLPLPIRDAARNEQKLLHARSSEQPTQP